MKIKFDLCVIRIKGRLSIAGSYLKTLEESLPHAKKTAINELKAKAKAESWAAEEYFMDEDILDHDFQEIPVMAGNSFTAYLHGMVEHGLTSICERLQEKKKLPIGVKDIAGSPIDRAKTYLTKLAGIRVGSDPGWQGLRDLAQLRNIILHAGGEVQNSSRTEDDIKRIQKRYPGEVLVKSHDWLEIGDISVSLSLCRRFLSEVESFFGRLLKAAELD